MCVAPDGSIFVADWYDRGVGGHGMGDPTDGRIYRITPKGHKGYKVPEVKLDTKEGVLAALGSPCLATRPMALQPTVRCRLELRYDADGRRSQSTSARSRMPRLQTRSKTATPNCRRSRLVELPRWPIETSSIELPEAHTAIALENAAHARQYRGDLVQPSFAVDRDPDQRYHWHAMTASPENSS